MQPSAPVLHTVDTSFKPAASQSPAPAPKPLLHSLRSRLWIFPHRSPAHRSPSLRVGLHLALARPKLATMPYRSQRLPGMENLAPPNLSCPPRLMKTFSWNHESPYCERSCLNFRCGPRDLYSRRPRSGDRAYPRRTWTPGSGTHRRGPRYSPCPGDYALPRLTQPPPSDTSRLPPTG